MRINVDMDSDYESDCDFEFDQDETDICVMRIFNCHITTDKRTLQAPNLDPVCRQVLDFLEQEDAEGVHDGQSHKL